MSAQDYRVNAEVRRLLVSRWIDVSMVKIGTTNGVVYLMGTFEPSVEDALERSGVAAGISNPAERLLRLISLVEKELRRVAGVRDIVFQFKNLRRKGRAWNVVGASGSNVVSSPVTSIEDRSGDSKNSPVEAPGEVPPIAPVGLEDGRNE